jgi:hypothetical protein
MLQGEDQQYTKKAGSARTARPLSRPCFLSFLQFLVYLPIEHWLSTYLDERSVVKGLVFFFWFSNSNNRAESKARWWIDDDDTRHASCLRSPRDKQSSSLFPKPTPSTPLLDQRSSAEME